MATGALRSTDTLRVDVDGNVGIIRFSRPERRNALHDDMYAPMMAAVDAFAADPAIGCVVLTGEGSAFCAGDDLLGGCRTGEQNRIGF